MSQTGTPNNGHMNLHPAPASPSSTQISTRVNLLQASSFNNQPPQRGNVFKNIVTDVFSRRNSSGSPGQN
jgi:hypothetical protein